jgi:hypothetical protein
MSEVRDGVRSGLEGSVFQRATYITLLATTIAISALFFLSILAMGTIIEADFPGRIWPIMVTRLLLLRPIIGCLHIALISGASGISGGCFAAKLVG